MTNKRSSRAALAGLALLLAIGLPGLADARDAAGERSGGPLDGLVFVGETGPTGKQKGRSDTFVFENGRFRAASFSAYGFAGATYESRQTEDGLRFKVTVVSSPGQGGTMVWTGTLHDDVLEGTLRWDHGWESRRYWFRGTSQAAQIVAR